MKSNLSTAACLVAMLCAVAPAPAQDGLTEEEVREIVRSALAEQEADSGGEWKVGTKNHITFESPDGQFKYQIGGRIQQHWTAWSADKEFAAAGVPLEDSTYLRRARLYVSGLVWGNVYFKAQYEFADSAVKAADVYMELREFDNVKLRVGHFYEPFGYDVMVSDNDSTFVERTSGESGETPNRNMGFMVHNPYLDERGTWAIGAFRPTDGNGKVVNDGHLSYTGRVTYLPMDEDDGRKLIHVGAAASWRDPDDGLVSYAAEPEARKANDVIDAGTLMVDGVALYGLEFCGTMGQFSWQSEYMASMNDLEMGGTADFEHYYAQLSYIVTGEHRAYKRSSGAHGTVRPQHNFGEEGGFGAIEVAARYSVLDFKDGSIDGGVMDQVTFGVNWYLNPNVRVMADVVLVDVDSIAGTTGVDGSAEAFTMRFQVNF